MLEGAWGSFAREPKELKRVLTSATAKCADENVDGNLCS